MPCTDGGDYRYADNSALEAEKRLEEREAMLCGVMAALDKAGCFHSIMYHADWPRAGVTQDRLLEWWKAHKKKKDKARSAEEAAAEKLAKRRAKALAKLSRTDRELLDLLTD